METELNLDVLEAIYGTKFTIGLIRNKLEEHNLLKGAKIYEVEQGSTIDAGKMNKDRFWVPYDIRQRKN